MGFARFVLSKTNTLVGTPDYMAPATCFIESFDKSLSCSLLRKSSVVLVPRKSLISRIRTTAVLTGGHLESLPSRCLPWFRLIRPQVCDACLDVDGLAQMAHSPKDSERAYAVYR